MARIEEQKEVLPQGRLSRRAVMRALGAGAVVTAAGVPAVGRAQVSRVLSATDRYIVNFLLNLEYVAAEFYLFGVTGTGLTPADTTGLGIGGPTSGGKKITFTDATLAAIMQQVMTDEVAHVRLLRSLLGRPAAMSKPAINLNARNFGFGNEDEFLVASRQLEDLAVSAYTDLVPQMDNRNVMSILGRVLGTEGYHAGNIREQVVLKGLTAAHIDPTDVLPTMNSFFPSDANGLTPLRFIAEVRQLAQPFLPVGPNLPVL